MTARVRRIRPDDGQLLRGLRLRALADAPGAFASTFDEEAGRPTGAWDADADARSAGDGSATFVVESTGGIVGLVGAYLNAEERGTVELVSMWVAPDARREGLGTRLVEQVVDWAREGGACRVALWVVRGNRPAIALYERSGFVPTGLAQVPATHPCREELRMVHELGDGARARGRCTSSGPAEVPTARRPSFAPLMAECSGPQARLPSGGMRISARNQLAGRVVRVDHGAVMSTVVIRLDGGQEVVAAITKDSAEGLELAAGDPVLAVIKSTEVMIAKEL